VLGPFQGPVGMYTYKKGRGVCGTSWANAETLIVPDVHQFPGHIACSAFSKSEIVVPLLHNGKVVAVLDADSELPAHFDEIDGHYLEMLIGFISFL